jgi:hypothetical protein
MAPFMSIAQTGLTRRQPVIPSENPPKVHCICYWLLGGGGGLCQRAVVNNLLVRGGK